MVIPGEKVISLGLISGAVDADTQMQPSGFDLTLKSIHSMDGQGEVDFDNTHRSIPKYLTEVITQKTSLPTGSYFVEFNETISLPADIIATLFIRSSLMRSGCSLDASLIDAGYAGPLAATLHVSNPAGIVVHPNARIAQCAFFQMVESASAPYSGRYQNKDIGV